VKKEQEMKTKGGKDKEYNGDTDAEGEEISGGKKGEEAEDMEYRT